METFTPCIPVISPLAELPQWLSNDSCEDYIQAACFQPQNSLSRFNITDTHPEGYTPWSSTSQMEDRQFCYDCSGSSVSVEYPNVRAEEEGTLPSDVETGPALDGLYQDMSPAAPLPATWINGEERCHYEPQLQPLPLRPFSSTMSEEASIQCGRNEASFDYTSCDSAGFPEHVAEMHHSNLLPYQQSAYSELSANLVYMAALAKAANTIKHESRSTVPDRQRKEKGSTMRKEKSYIQTLDVASATEAALLSQIDWTQETLKKSGRGIVTNADVVPISMIRYSPQGSKPLTVDKPPPRKRIPPPPTTGKIRKISSSGSGKKLGLACHFCRERKIACGRPSESSPDQTCNQCARRLFKCEYPTESRRGQYKRPKSKPGVVT